ncbi:glycerate kinase [Sporosarcina trichiuri]|uniref:glycerate kinase n=1 Tax=Sporosarcina trichiuri TaxID=3056445 RepID=UPI0025B54D70|nr:glycerate kinase [Sporosarcina sp. 0.2-SM1T-5]WJY26866.1 glycerate kinase [Sporosarcina sp. 0.2-SM1T-5]
MKILIAPDSFKGSLTAGDAAAAIAAGVQQAVPGADCVLLPAADGGEGTMENLVNATGGHTVSIMAEDPIGRMVSARYGVLGSETACVIELAESSGLMRLLSDEYAPLTASTYGMGQLLRHALDEGHRNFLIGLGGSATTDGGAGLLQALGMQLLDSRGEELPRGGAALAQLQEIRMESFDPRIAACTFRIACDVTNPLIGPGGAAAVFAPQKGAGREDVVRLETGLTQFLQVIERATGQDLSLTPHTGAAGGTGAAFAAFFPAEFQPGIDLVLEALLFRHHLQDADLVITGEGRSDQQTLAGKAPDGIARIADEYGVPAVLLSGMIDEQAIPLLQARFSSLHSLVTPHVTRLQAMADAEYLLQQTAYRILKERVDG